MQHEVQVSLERENDPLTHPRETDDAPAFQLRKRRRDGSQEKGTAQAHRFEALADDARLERCEVGEDVGQLRHAGDTIGVVRPIRMSLLSRYARWLHTMWPAGTVEKLPEVRPDGTTAIPGVRVVGDLTGIPLLKFSSDTGARAVLAIVEEPDFRGGAPSDALDLAIVGGGVSGLAAAMEAKKAGLSFRVFEAGEPLSTVVNFPRAKPIYTYPVGMTPTGDLQFRAEVHPKETLLADLESQRRRAGIEFTPARIEKISRRDGLLHLRHADGTETRARRVIVAIGRSGNHRRLGVRGENLDKVFNRLY